MPRRDIPSCCAAFLKHVLGFVIIYATLLLLLSHLSARDPGSVFFDAKRAERPRYSAERSKQADALIKSAWLKSKTGHYHHNETGDAAPPLCIGIKSTTHKRARSLRTTIGSLLQGLDQGERRKIDLKVLIAHSDPLLHPAVHEPWLRNTVDDVVFYNATLSPAEMEKLLTLEKNAEDQEAVVQEEEEEKEVFDYTYLLKTCFESGSEYIAMLADDVVAVDGWLHRSLAALEEAEERSYKSEKWDDFLYLRLFYTEKALGWKPHDRPSHIFWSIFTVSSTAAALFTIRTWKPRSTIGRNITAYSTFWICCIAMPLLMILYFSSGRLTVQPLQHGLVEMHDDHVGCCSHGLVFPHHQAGRLLEWFGGEKKKRRVGSLDALMEEFADANDRVRWTIVPSILQHTGRKMSGGDEGSKDWGVVETSWNIEFEEYDVARLKKEHQEVQAKGRWKEGRSNILNKRN